MPRERNALLSREIMLVRRTLSALDRALARFAARAQVAGAREGGASPRKRKLQLTPARRKALQLHGQYLGYVRQLKPRAKAQIRALRAKKGIRVAIARARRLAAA